MHTDAYGMRLLDFLERRWPDVHRAYFRRLVLAEMVKVNRIIGTPYTTLRRGDVIDIARPPGEPPPRPRAQVAAPPVARLVHQDDHLVVVDKPAGMSVDAAIEALGEAVPEGLRATLRMDADASGLVLLARDVETAKQLAADFEAGLLEVEWLALVDGRVDQDTMVIDKALGPDRRHQGRVRVYERDAKRSRPARTELVTVEVFARHTSVRVVPRTDRGHQVRAHLASIHHPIVGDAQYGGGSELFVSAFKRKFRPRVGMQEQPILSRLCLHAAALCWRGEAGARQWSSATPKDIGAALTRLRRYADQ